MRVLGIFEFLYKVEETQSAFYIKAIITDPMMRQMNTSLALTATSIAIYTQFVTKLEHKESLSTNI